MGDRWRHMLHSFYHKLLPLLVFVAIVAWFFVDNWYQFYPPIGTYIGILAFLAALMTIWPPEQPWSKAMWIMIFALLLILEIKTLQREKRANEQQQEVISRNFNGIAKNFKETSDNLKEILSGAEESRKEERNQFGFLLERQEKLFTRQEHLAKETLSKVKEREGTLVAAKLPKPISSCKVPDNHIAVYYGTNASWNMHFPYSAIRIRNDDVISFNIDQSGGLLVSANVFDDRGDLIVSIDNNKFEATYAASHMGKTASSLMVYDRRGKLALFVRFTNPYAIEIAGDFYSADGTKITIDDKKLFIHDDRLSSNKLTLSGSCFAGGSGLVGY